MRLIPALPLTFFLLATGCSTGVPDSEPAPETVDAVMAAPAPEPVPAELPLIDAQAFATCVGELQAEARAAGIAEAVITRDLANVRYLPKVIELDRRQPEFTDSLADYFGRRVTDARIRRGQALLAEHGQLLAGVERDYGVPAQYLVAFWGLETNFGSFFGNTPVLDALATLGCDLRRSRFFRDELLNALRIIEEGSVTAQRMQGSWAGAMGHVQFMPTTFLAHAVDRDGDGRRDLWGSLPDAMASAAHFLRALGWRAGEPWGMEVRVPAGFDYRQAGLDGSRAIAEWRALGVTLTDGAALPGPDGTSAALIVPTGHGGPAFLVGQNFRVIMKWNRSLAYALAVGHLGDRLTGGPAFSLALVDAPRLDRAQVKTLQERLNAQGFGAGKADGVLGSGTRAAIARYQHANGLVADGFPDREVLQHLGILSADPATTPPAAPAPAAP